MVDRRNQVGERPAQELARRTEEMLHRGGERRMPAAPDLEQPTLELAELRIDGRIEGALRPPRRHAPSLGSGGPHFVRIPRRQRVVVPELVRLAGDGLELQPHEHDSGEA